MLKNVKIVAWSKSYDYLCYEQIKVAKPLTNVV